MDDTQDDRDGPPALPDRARRHRGGRRGPLRLLAPDQVEKLIPYLVQSEDQVPGIPTWYASTCTECAAGCGLHVKTREARAIKLEGNPEHPVNAGKLCARGQAGAAGAVQSGPDPRPEEAARPTAASPTSHGTTRSRSSPPRPPAHGGKLAVLSGAGRGTFSDLLAAWTAALGGRVVRYAAVRPRADARRQPPGVRRWTSSRRYDFAQRRVHRLLRRRLPGDLAGAGREPARIRGSRTGSTTARCRAKWRLGAPDATSPASTPTNGSPSCPAPRPSLALAMAHVILAERSSAPADAGALRGMLAALHAGAGRPGRRGSPPTGSACWPASSSTARPSLAVAGGIGSQHAGRDRALRRGQHPQLRGRQRRARRSASGPTSITATATPALAGAPAGDGRGPGRGAPGARRQSGLRAAQGGGFADALAKVPFKVSTALVPRRDRGGCATSCCPSHHALERWDDLRPGPGCARFSSRSWSRSSTPAPPATSCSRWPRRPAGPLAPSFTAAVFEAAPARPVAGLRDARGAADSERLLARRAAARRHLRSTAPAGRREAGPGRRAGRRRTVAGVRRRGRLPPRGLPDSMYYDGRGANKPWLLENPDPVTKITWQSWVELHPETAADLDVREGEILRLTSPHGSLEAPAYLYPGVRRDVRRRAARASATPIRPATPPGGASIALDLLRAPDDGWVRALRARPGSAAGEDRRATRSWPRPRASHRQLGRGIAEAMPLAAARKGLTPSRTHYAEAGSAQHEINTERELEAIDGLARGADRGDQARATTPASTRSGA